ncbi:hypothetical protein CO033_01090 [Candidatus Nomurabacteria bacterium CG_4_9_14_0_2_um_filter_32_10]|uniref:VanZ-like domain-containing protein n=3 Tax=Candidatus Nomuraibacteriota TaxID=1752729 RepID=A0A2H0CHH5_9BACT|nr:MAG: hypothetical protein COW91_00570 [Candidatus Nomurabacteria bacterium CG22_combo_CG10-13_8_21_14_all_32_8]PIZ86419.1 MAG: hypothetical protein COX94_00105 [Candidatus Nomurabacteria bacterium CG_4_10_14_0_2_um_filter_33_9]PJC49532.1 MAG: hypothetical protein CO033_01090 [Candidatus Nomurabacteria bacterium CG_4_9_14_0_2_um_filter_32_10]
MDSKKLLIRLILIIFLIFLLNYLAMEFYWYSSIWYLDMPMHFLGGFWLGLIVIYLFFLKDDVFKSIFKILFFVSSIGIGWEIFEIVVNNYVTQNYFNYLDTISDIFFDLSGGLFAILYFLKNIVSVKENTQ